MSKYANVSLRATDNIINKIMSPPNAWQEAVRYIFHGKKASQQKGCPKCAFLGLCEEGFVTGISRGKYTNSKLNKHYAIKAVEHIRKTKNSSISSKKLWTIVAKGKKHNEQMDVVLALINKGYITI